MILLFFLVCLSVFVSVRVYPWLWVLPPAPSPAQPETGTPAHHNLINLTVYLPWLSFQSLPDCSVTHSGSSMLGPIFQCVLCSLSIFHCYNHVSPLAPELLLMCQLVFTIQQTSASMPTLLHNHTYYLALCLPVHHSAPLQIQIDRSVCNEPSAFASTHCYMLNKHKQIYIISIVRNEQTDEGRGKYCYLHLHWI